MKHPKWFKFKMEDEMRCRLKGIAKRRKCHSPDLVRMLVDRLIAYENDPHVVDLTVWSNTVNKAAIATNKATNLRPNPRRTAKRMKWIGRSARSGRVRNSVDARPRPLVNLPTCVETGHARLNQMALILPIHLPLGEF